MASMATSGPESNGKGSRAVPSRNPLPLSNTQEAQVREIYHSRVRQKCAQEIKEFAECATGRTLSVSWACLSHKQAMNNCLRSHATPAEQDAAREEWFARRVERHREREIKTVRKQQQEDFLREWWGLPEADRERRRQEWEKMNMDERVGGFAARGRRADGQEEGKGR